MARKQEAKRPRVLVVVSDLHVGSDYAVMPRGFKDKSGRPIGLNPAQEWLIEVWDACVDWVEQMAGDDPWALVVNGDVIDGFHHNTKEIFTHDESDQRSAAGALLIPFALKAAKTYMLAGTESHTKGHEHTLAGELRAAGAVVAKPNVGGAYDKLRLKCAGTLCHFSHHMPTSSRPHLEASALSIVLGCERQEQCRIGNETPKVIIRSHRHKFGLFTDGYSTVIATPPWQGLTRFGHKVVSHAVPQVGMVMLDWRLREDGELPAVHECLYTIPEPEPEEL